jgi:hypothetical protein
MAACGAVGRGFESLWARIETVFRLRSAADAYQVLTNKEILEKVLQQGLKEEQIATQRRDSRTFHKYEG